MELHTRVPVGTRRGAEEAGARYKELGMRFQNSLYLQTISPTLLLAPIDRMRQMSRRRNCRSRSKARSERRMCRITSVFPVKQTRINYLAIRFNLNPICKAIVRLQPPCYVSTFSHFPSPQRPTFHLGTSVHPQVSRTEFVSVLLASLRCPNCIFPWLYSCLAPPRAPGRDGQLYRCR